MSAPKDVLPQLDDLEWNITSTPEDYKRKTPASQQTLNKFKKLCSDNPFIPLGLVATTGVLATGVYYHRKQNSRMQQIFMRLRVSFQFLTVGALFAGSLLETYRSKK